MSRSFGEASYGGNFKKNEYRKLKDGTNTYRILPPIGDLAKDGKWAVFYKVHYGFKSSKGRMIPFQSPEVKNRKGMIEVPDAALERLNMMKAQYEKAKKEGNQDALAILEPLVGTKKAQFNIDNNHHVNAIDEQGNVVILKLRHRAKLVLDEKIKTLRAAGIDPLSVTNGRVFVFTRSGNALDTSFQVDILKEKLMVEGVGEVERAVISTLSKDTIEKCLKDAADLNKLYKRPTSEEVARIVKVGAAAVDEILDTSGTSAAASDDSGDTGYDEAEAADAAKALAAPAPAPVQAAAPTPAPTAPQIVQPQVTAAPATQSTAKALSDMNTDEFLASLNLGN